MNNIFAGLRKIGKTLSGSLNRNVPHFNGFEDLEVIGEDVIFTGFSLALEISGFNQLLKVGATFPAASNALNEKISGFENLKEVGANFEVQNNPSLKSLDGFAALETVGGDFLLISVFSFENILQFDLLHTIGGSLVIRENFNMEELQMGALQAIGANLTIGESNSNFHLLSAPNLISIGGDFTIGRFNFDLDTFAMSSLETINGSFQFDSFRITKFLGMDNLRVIGADFIPSTSLFSFENFFIQSVGGNFVLDTMSFIRHVDELESLTEIGGDLIVSRSPRLEDLHGFAQLMSIGGNVLIANNPALADCSGICTAFNRTGIEGSLEISNNRVGCNDFTEVEPACAATPTEDLTLSSYIDVFPNPVANEFHIRAEGLNMEKLTLFDVAGRDLWINTVGASDLYSISVADLNKGVYFVRISLQGGQKIVKKVIKE